MKKLRVAFDLDETLGTPIIENEVIVGFNLRQGSIALLQELAVHYELILWTVSRRTYVDKVLKYGLEKYFQTIYTWDELANLWKDVRQLEVEYLIDDDELHRTEAKLHGLESHYVIIPAYGGPIDSRDPFAWSAQIREILLP